MAVWIQATGFVSWFGESDHMPPWGNDNCMLCLFARNLHHGSGGATFKMKGSL